MALACPACGRPNHERLESCVYCGALLPRPEPLDASSAVAPAPTPPGDLGPSEVEPPPLGPWRRQWLLVLERASEGLPSPPGAELVQSVADALAVDGYLSRKHLTSRQPTVVARGEDPEALEALAGKLAALGLVTTLISPAELAAVGDPWLAEAVEFAGEQAPEGFRGAIGFRSRHTDEILVVRPGEVELVVQGVLKVLLPDRSGAARSIGSVLQWSSPSKEALEELRSDFPLVEIHRSRGPRVRLCLADFDFSGLGDRKRPSALLNLRLLVRELLAGSPNAVVDDSFRFLTTEFDPGAGALGLPSTNEPQFDRYARLLAAQRRKRLQADPVSRSRTNR